MDPTKAIRIKINSQLKKGQSARKIFFLALAAMVDLDSCFNFWNTGLTAAVLAWGVCKGQ